MSTFRTRPLEMNFASFTCPNTARRGAALLLTVLASAFAATPSLSNDARQISGIWSGLDKTNFNGQLRQIRLSLAPTEATATNLPILPPDYNSSAQRPAPFSGTLVSTVSSARHGSQSETVAVAGYYFPSTDVAILYWQGAGRFVPRSAQIAVLSPDRQHFAIFHTGASRNSLPYVLARGESPPSSLQRISNIKSSAAIARALPPNPLSILKARKQQKAAAKAQQEAAMALLEASRKLQQEMIEAARAGDQQRVAELRQQLQDIALNGVAQQTGQIPAGTPVAPRSNATGCPQHLLDWAAEMDNHGASQNEFNGLIQVANLFRPEMFVPHFGKAFDEIGKQEAFQIGMDLQRRCLVPSTPLYHSPIATSLASAFGDAGGFSRFDAASAALALELLADWQNHVSQRIDESGSLELAEAYQVQRAALAAKLWPEEAKAAQESVAQSISRKVAQEILEQARAIAAGLGGDGASALVDLMILRRNSMFHKLTPEQASTLESQFWQILDEPIETYLDKALASIQSSSEPRHTLIEGRKWYGRTGDALTSLSSRPYYVPFVKAFTAGRENAFAQLKSELVSELDAIQDRNQAATFAGHLAISLDSSFAPTWRELQEKRTQRVNEIDRETFIARVGDGPFGPDYPGAIYLNAIYRGDQARMAEEDRLFQDPLIAYMQPLLQPGLMDLFGMFTGGIVSGDQLRELMIASARKQSILEPLLAYFVVNYESRYPQCMDPRPARIKRTTTWETVTRWSDGWETRSPAGETVDYIDVNQRHKAAWLSFEGNASNPETLEFFNFLDKSLTPNGNDFNVSPISQSLRGMRQAMSDYPCDHDVIKTLENNLLALYEGRPPERNLSPRTSWKAK